MKRRDFLIGGVVAAGGGATGFFGSELLKYLASAPETPWKALTAPEAKEVDRIAEELIPADEIWGGAHDANVVRYIDWQLAPGAPFERHLKTYRKHLELVKGMGAAEIEKKFPDFFGLILRHTKQGFYGHPNHGGNAGYISWRMFGVDAPSNVGRNVPGKKNHL